MFCLFECTMKDHQRVECVAIPRTLKCILPTCKYKMYICSRIRRRLLYLANLELFHWRLLLNDRTYMYFLYRLTSQSVESIIIAVIWMPENKIETLSYYRGKQISEKLPIKSNDAYVLVIGAVSLWSVVLLRFAYLGSTNKFSFHSRPFIFK